MKLSVSLPEEDVAFLDEYASTRGATSRSAALHHAVALLRTRELSESYLQSWAEWEPEADAWDRTVVSGLDAR
ncbi:MAG: ribbon-helix-helix domain-containing protein [Pseudonocardiaceae bacterium]